VTFSPVVTSSGLTEDEVIWSEKLTEWTSSDRIHSTWFEIHQDSSWDITTSSSFIVINIDSFQLEIRISVVGSGWINSVFIRDDLPEFGTNLVTALTSLDVNDFSHFYVLIKSKTIF
jgi:hypothetical protein